MSGILSHLHRRFAGPALVRAVAGGGAAQRALLLYSTRAFLPVSERVSHQNVAQQRELARALGELGFEVDVADYDETRRGLLRESYHLVVDLHPVVAPLYHCRLTPGARRIAYITGSNPEIANAAELERLEDLARRRGARLRPKRQTRPFSRAVLESFDAVFLIGGRETLATYAAFRLPHLHLLPNSGWDELVPTPPARRDAARFLFLGSAGQVHKGLDLLLELFAAESGLELFVCSDFRRERDFTRAYRRELFATAGIHPVGFVDVRGAAFRELQATCATMLLPSCAEGQAGTVTLALAFGLPCAVSRACGFDDPELVTFPDCTPATLRDVVRRLATRTPEELARHSSEALALYRRRYRPEHYAASVRDALRAVLAGPGGAGWAPTRAS